MAKQYIKLGAMLQGKKGPYLVLGNSKATEAKYNSTVDIRVTDGDGKVLLEGANGLISLFDPRKRPGISADQLDRIPDSVLYELIVIKGE